MVDLLFWSVAICIGIADVIGLILCIRDPRWRLE